MKSTLLSLLASAAVSSGLREHPAYETSRPPFATIQPTLASIYAAQATTQPESPTSNIEGKAFDRIVQIWLENVDFEWAADDANMQWLAQRGITLENYFAVTHPSQPNYAAAAAGDYFGMDGDNFVSFPANISTVVDLLDTRRISWGEYQEDIPYAGFTGNNFSNQDTSASDYVRKHNPLILFDSVAHNASRVRQIKNFEHFYDDLHEKKIPQWVFITPNMTNDAHDTNITFAAKWARGFLEPLLENEYFMEKTLVIVSFDECYGYDIPNKVFTLLLGGAIPPSLHGTADSATHYSHYSTLSTVSLNWDLPSLGRWDCHANILPPLSRIATYRNAQDIQPAKMLYNESYPGPVAEKKYTPGWWPSPNTVSRCASGQGVLGSVRETWGVTEGSYDYDRAYPDDWHYGGGQVHGKGYGYGYGYREMGGNKSKPKVVVSSGEVPLNGFRSHMLSCLGYVAVIALL